MQVSHRPSRLEGPSDFFEVHIAADCTGACQPVHGEVAFPHHTQNDIARYDQDKMPCCILGTQLCVLSFHTYLPTTEAHGTMAGCTIEDVTSQDMGE